ncbi:MAG TPA: TolC family protein, partial [Bacteroidales bacterium]|nr:TolC family protein [Bacteroidales bacterium]
KRPEYSILQNKIAYKEQELKMTRATYLPTIGLKGGYTHIGGIQINSQDYSNSNVQFIVSVNIPLFAWTEGKQKLASAQIDIKNQELELEKNSELMKLELEKTKQDMKHALTQIRINEKAVMQSQENLRITQNNYIIGKIPVSDVLTAQTLWQQASTNLIQSKIDYANYVCMYKKLIGILYSKLHVTTLFGNNIINKYLLFAEKYYKRLFFLDKSIHSYKIKPFPKNTFFMYQESKYVK